MVISIKRKSNGEFIYVLSDVAASKDKYITIETPNGSHYHVILCDGSQVWSNAVSSIKNHVKLKSKE